MNLKQDKAINISNRNWRTGTLAVAALATILAVCLASLAKARSTGVIPPPITTPDRVEMINENVQQVQGAVDKQTQRVTWVVVNRKNIIFDTGLYNLAKDETTILVHEGPDKTQQWTLVRLKQPAGGKANQ